MAQTCKQTEELENCDEPEKVSQCLKKNKNKKKLEVLLKIQQKIADA